MTGDYAKDLIVLVADKDAEQAITRLVKRDRSLRIRPITADVIVHPLHDTAFLNQCADFLRPYANRYRHALAVFDRHGCGQEEIPRQELEHRALSQLEKSGWEERSQVIVLDPELESWVWSQSSHVPRALGWDTGYEAMREWLRQNGFLRQGADKPDDPKGAMKAAIAEVNMKWSSSIFANLADAVGMGSCSEPSFRKFIETMRKWFG